MLLMNYDQHWLTSLPGPIAAQDWYVENLRQILKIVPAQKIIAAVGNYAYDWSEAPKKKPEPAESLTIQEALVRAAESETQVEFDSASLNPHYSYNDQHEHVHQVWMLDALTAYNQLRANERYGRAGDGAVAPGFRGYVHVADLGRHAADRRHSRQDQGDSAGARSDF